MIRRLIIPMLVLGASCSSPLRETSEPQQSAEEPVVVEQPAAPRPPPVASEPVFAAPEEAPTPVAATEAPAEKPAAPRVVVAPDPVKELFAEEARRVENEQTIVRLAEARDAAAATVAQREKDLLAFKNPFLPRPRLGADDAAAIQGMGGAARARWAEAQVAEAKTLLDAAQKAYDDAKANR